MTDNDLAQGIHKSIDNPNTSRPMQLCINAANEFASLNAKTCINIISDSGHYSSILKVHVSEKKLNEVGFIVNTNAINCVGLWIKGASVSDNKQHLGSYRCGTFIQSKIDDAITTAKLQNKNYTAVKINLAELDLLYPELKNVQKVLNIIVEFVMQDSVPYH